VNLPSELVDSVIAVLGAVVGWLLRMLRERLTRKP